MRGRKSRGPRDSKVYSAKGSCRVQPRSKRDRTRLLFSLKAQRGVGRKVKRGFGRLRRGLSEPPSNQSLNLTGAAFSFGMALCSCSGPGKLACAFGGKRRTAMTRRFVVFSLLAMLAFTTG